MSSLPPSTASSTLPVQAPRGKILMMAGVAGAVITNIYSTQPILPLIAEDLHIGISQVDLIAGSALLGFSTGLASLLPLGDRHPAAHADLPRGR